MEKIKVSLEKVGIKGTLLYIDKTTKLYFSKGFIYYENGSASIQRVRLPLTGLKALAAKFRLGERALRLFPRCAVKLSEKCFLISYSGKAYLYDAINNTLEQEHEYCEGMNNPLSFTKIEGIGGFPDCIAYGEYRDNEKHTPLGIYERVNGEWKKAADFPYDIKHIHGLVPDKENACVYVLTGDEDNESGIWIAKDNFLTIEPMQIGKQMYRGCVAFPSHNGIIYATDTPKEKNTLYWSGKSGKHLFLLDMPGPCVYGGQKDGYYFFITSVEPNPKLPSWRYKISATPGPGNKDGYVHIIAGNLDVGFEDIAKFKKDFWLYRMFQFGNALFVNCDIPNTICVDPIAVQQYDNTPVLISFKNEQ